jgi:RHS repeat-associated protein
MSKLGSSEIFHDTVNPIATSNPANVAMTAKLTNLTGKIQMRFDSLGVIYRGTPQGSAGLVTSETGRINSPQMYFYHSDHLGSSSLITDNNGTLVQHLEYVPFGEVFVEENKSTWSTPYKFTSKELDAETGLYYFGARYYDPKTSVWLSVDPLAEKYPNYSSYNYCLNNPIKYIDPDGNSPISVFAKIIAKQGVKVAVKTFAKNQIEHRLKNYMSKNLMKQFAKDLDDIIGTLDNEWWETALELVPVAGDIYGGTKFGIKIAKAFEKLQELENKYVEKIYNSLPKELRKKFKDAMRNAGVRDARKDQSAGVENLGDTYKKGSDIDGHHKEAVSEQVSMSSDPRNIEFMTKDKHIETHKKKSTIEQ